MDPARSSRLHNTWAVAVASSKAQGVGSHRRAEVAGEGVEWQSAGLPAEEAILLFRASVSTVRLGRRP